MDDLLKDAIADAKTVRETECYVIEQATMATPDVINFMAK